MRRLLIVIFFLGILVSWLNRTPGIQPSSWKFSFLAEPHTGDSAKSPEI